MNHYYLFFRAMSWHVQILLDKPHFYLPLPLNPITEALLLNMDVINLWIHSSSNSRNRKIVIMI